MAENPVNKVLKIIGPLPLPPSENSSRAIVTLIVEHTGQRTLNLVKWVEV